jgi:hypothetical protein
MALGGSPKKNNPSIKKWIRMIFIFNLL